MSSIWHIKLLFRDISYLIRSFHHSWLITGFVTWITRRVPLVEQKVLTFSEHPSSPLVCNGVCVARSFLFCAMFCRSLFVLLLLLVWPLYYLSFFDLQLMIIPLSSLNLSYMLGCTLHSACLCFTSFVFVFLGCLLVSVLLSSCNHSCKLFEIHSFVLLWKDLEISFSQVTAHNAY